MLTEILKQIRHELLWNEEEWKWENEEEAEIQVDQISEYVTISINKMIIITILYRFLYWLRICIYLEEIVATCMNY